MKKTFFFRKLLMIIFIIIVLDMVLGMLLHRTYFSLKNGEQQRTTYAVDSLATPVLILGASRASHHYVTDILGNYLQQNCYNAGKDKQGIFYCLAVLKAVSARKAPRYVIMDITDVSFAADELGLDELSVLLPYYRKHPEIQSIINRRSRWEPVKTYSSLYCYNSLVLQIIFNSFSGGQSDAVNGYIPLNRNFDGLKTADEIASSKEKPLDSLLVHAFKELVGFCKEHDCRLAVVVSPYWSPVQPALTIQKAEEICRLAHVPFFNYSKSPEFINHTNLFADPLHLNHEGATIFSKQLGSALQPAFLPENQSPLITQ